MITGYGHMYINGETTSISAGGDFQVRYRTTYNIGISYVSKNSIINKPSGILHINRNNAGIGSIWHC